MAFFHVFSVQIPLLSLNASSSDWVCGFLLNWENLVWKSTATPPKVRGYGFEGNIQYLPCTFGHGFWDFGKKMARLSWFQVCLFCVCVLLTFLGSIVSTVQARGRGGFFEVRFPSKRPGQWHPTTSVHIQNIGLNYNCRSKAFYDHFIRIETTGGGRLSIFLIWEVKQFGRLEDLFSCFV